MCVVKKPKVQNTTAKEKEPIVIRNNYLDGLDPASKALRRGRSSLRIERTGTDGTNLPPVSGGSVSPPVPAAAPSSGKVEWGPDLAKLMFGKMGGFVKGVFVGPNKATKAAGPSSLASARLTRTPVRSVRSRTP